MNGFSQAIFPHTPTSGVCPFSVIRPISRPDTPLAHGPNRTSPPCTQPRPAATGPKRGLHGLQENSI